MDVTIRNRNAMVTMTVTFVLTESLPVKACPLLFQPFAFPVMLIITQGLLIGIVRTPGRFLRMLVSHGGLDVFYQCLAPFEISVLGEGIAAGSRFATMDDSKFKNNKKGRGTFSGWSGFSREMREVHLLNHRRTR
ncbi:hypothetical protein QQF64_035288 [Cirrhinus molitorella]|uniref:Uncharacterized protein n=1 Tax=Cirrhinus molitorella TaxID=172907 RepID=A0ABR3NG70_9TELE